MVMRIQPGVYLIRNKRENTYIGTETGYGRAGTKAMLDDWNMQGTQKWLVDYLAPYGTYVIKNFANMDVYLQPGAPPSRRDVPKAEINSYQFQWVIAEAPNGHGYFIVKADEQDQVLQAVSYGPDVVVDDLDTSRSNRRQIWLFETVN